MSEFKSKLTAQIRALGVSPQGETWLKKALYPPGEETLVSIPDSTWLPRMRIDSRPVMTFGPHASLPLDASWDAIVIAPPGDVTAAILVTAPAGTNFASSTAPANFGVRHLSNLPSSLGAGIQKTYEVGIRTSAGASSVAQRTAVSSPMRVQQFRSTYRGITIHNTSSSLYNGGTLLAAQFAPASCDENLGFTTRDAVVRFFNQKVYDIPLTDDAIAQMCPGAMATEAKDGTFLPLRLLGPVQTFTKEVPSVGMALYPDNNGNVTTIANGNSGGTVASANSMPSGFVAWAGVSPIVPFWINSLSALTGKIDDTNFDNVAVGVVTLRGLPYQASFSLQAYVGLECILDTESPFRSLMTSAPTYDARALQAYYDIVTTMPFSYPAAFNSLGALIPFLSRAMTTLGPMFKTVAPHALSALKSLAPQIAPFVSSLLQRGADESAAKATLKPKRQKKPRPVVQVLEQPAGRLQAGPWVLEAPRRKPKGSRKAKRRY